MDLRLKDKVALIGGASQVIGYGIAHMLAGEGAKIIITARRCSILKFSAAILFSL